MEHLKQQKGKNDGYGLTHTEPKFQKKEKVQNTKEKILEEVIAENFPEILKDVNLQIQESQDI